MKVLFLCGADHKYGTSKMAKNIMESMKRYNNIEFIVLTQKFGLINQFCNQKKIENYVIPYRYCVYAPHPIKVLNIVKKYLKYVIVSFCNRRALAKLENMVDLHSVDIIHTNINRDLLGMLISEKYDIPNVTHLREFSKEHFHLDFLYPNQIRFMNLYSKKFIAISKAVEKDWIKRGLDGRKMEMIYDGVQKNEVVFKEKSSHDIVKIVMCGGIYEGKGQLQLVRAISVLKDRNVNNISVDIYGDNEGKADYVSIIKRFISDHGLENIVHLRGYKSGVSKILYKYDVGIVCSKSEGFGLVTVEYMLAGLCPIVSDTGANQELVLDNISGIVYHYEDIESLANALEKIVRNEFIRKDLAKNARKRASEKFTMDRCADEMANLYLEIAGDKNVCNKYS